MLPPRVLAIVLLACLLLAGCSGGGGEQDDGPGLTGKTESRILDETAGSNRAGDGGAANAASGLGEIRGLVVDDAQLPVAGAFLSLLGSANSTATDQKGTFQIGNVTPGDYVLRVVSSYYRVHEGALEVRADRVTDVVVTLVPAQDVGPGYRPHLHDYWGTATELLLFDQRLDWLGAGPYGTYPAAGTAYQGAYAANQANIWLAFGVPERDDGLPPIVLPGTGKLVFTLSWDENDVDVDGFHLQHTSAFASSTFGNPKVLRNGEPLELEVNETMADNGHQRFSLWQFRIQPTARTPPNTILGDLQAKVTMVKGVVPVEKAHEDFWESNATYLTRDFAPPYVYGTICCNDAHIVLSPDNRRLVPPGTQKVTMLLWGRSTNGNGTPLDMDWNLNVKTADLPPGADWSEYTALTPTASSGGMKSYEMKVDPGMTDAFYQRTSNWRFWVKLPDAQHTPIGVTEYGHTFHLEVIAHKDPGFQ